VVSMEDRRLLRLESDGSLSEAADLTELATFHCNDMVVDAGGRAYVGNFGFDLHEKEAPREAEIVLVEPDGQARIAAAKMSFPNGSVITPDGRTLIVGETFAACLTAFTIESDGSLSGRREWAKLEQAIPDGICLDAEGGIWVASPVGHQVLRVLEGGEVTDRIAVENESFACMLGGAEGRTLFVCTAATSDPKTCEVERTGRIEFTEVDVPRAGLP
jgi:sugar lactone lactonase YvrE